MKGLLRIIIISFSLSFPIISACQTEASCEKGPKEGEVFDLGNGNYVAAIKTSCFNFYTSNQRENNWCWAACIQMVLNYQGLYIDQCEIVKVAYGACLDRPADCSTIIEVAGSWSYQGYNIKAWQDYDVSVKNLIHALAHKYPVIIGLNNPTSNIGHAYVLTAIYYNYDDQGNKIPYQVKLRDPWYLNPDIYITSWADFSSRINCMAHVTLN